MRDRQNSWRNHITFPAHRAHRRTNRRKPHSHLEKDSTPACRRTPVAARGLLRPSHPRSGAPPNPATHRGGIFPASFYEQILEQLLLIFHDFHQRPARARKTAFFLTKHTYFGTLPVFVLLPIHWVFRRWNVRTRFPVEIVVYSCSKTDDKPFIKPVPVHIISRCEQSIHLQSTLYRQSNYRIFKYLH